MRRCRNKRESQNEIGGDEIASFWVDENLSKVRTIYLTVIRSLNASCSPKSKAPDLVKCHLPPTMLHVLSFPWCEGKLENGIALTDPADLAIVDRQRAFVFCCSSLPTPQKLKKPSLSACFLLLVGNSRCLALSWPTSLLSVDAGWECWHKTSG